MVFPVSKVVLMSKCSVHTMAYFTSKAKVVFTPRAEDVSWDGRKILAVMLLDLLCL